MFQLESHGILLAPFFLCELDTSPVLVEVIARRLLKDWVLPHVSPTVFKLGANKKELIHFNHPTMIKITVLQIFFMEL